MAIDQQRRDRLVAEILRGVPSQPSDWSSDDLRRFAENVARAIEHAFTQEMQDSQQPDFGEEDRTQ